MKVEHIIQLIGVLFVPIVGFASAYFGYRFATKRERRAKTSELMLPSLINAYVEITRWLSKGEREQLSKKFVDAIHLVQLLGNPKMVCLCNRFNGAETAEDFLQSLQNLVLGLWAELRQHLDLRPTDPPVLKIE